MSAKLDSYNNIPEAFYACVKSKPKQTVYEWFATKGSSGSWQQRNYAEVSERVNKIANYLKSVGLKRGEKVAIIAQSRPEWVEADLAILACGGVSVSVYQSLPPTEVGYILFDSETKIVFLENQEQADKLKWLSTNDCFIPATEERAEQRVRLNFTNIISFEKVADPEVKLLEEILTTSAAKFPESEYIALTRKDLATLVYTSGTTGPPKGVRQTHGNHLANCRQAWNAHILEVDYSIMVFLPLAHSFAKLMGYLGCLSDASLKFPAVFDTKTSKLDPASMTRDICSASANLVPIVPRLLEKMQSGIIAKGRAGGIAGNLIRLTIWGARKMQISRQTGRAASIFAQIAYHGTSALRQKIRLKLFGPNFVNCISGGARLNEETAEFFDALGIDVLQGYGLTETCVATNVNRLGANRIGTVGPVLDTDIEMRLSADGEICFRGPNIAKGYFNRTAATVAAWDDSGWFHTGDLGSIDADGYLSIVGRKKDILVSSYGKNIAPDPIEASLKSSPYISQVVLVGEGKPFCSSVVTLEDENIRNWAVKQGIKLQAELATDPQVLKLIDQEIAKVNKQLANHEAVRKFVIAASDFTIENGLLTPTFKVKKKLVLELYKSEIAEIYKDS